MNIYVLILISSLLLISNPLQSQELKFELNTRHAADVERDQTSKAAEIIRLADIKEGMAVFDLLGGGGYYSELLSHAVGQTGRVYLHNNKAYMPYVEKELEARLRDGRLPNVQRYDSETEDLGIKNESFDALFYILGYHDIYHQAEGWKIDRQGFLAQIKHALKSGGKLVIVDHSALAGTGTSDAQVLHRIDVEYVKQEVSALGFELTIESNVLSNHADTRKMSPFEPEIRRKTDRFVLIFTKQ